jgi:hypothetical protein
MTATANRALRWVLIVVTVMAGLTPAFTQAGLAAAATARAPYGYDLPDLAVATPPNLADEGREDFGVDVGRSPAATRADPPPSRTLLTSGRTVASERRTDAAIQLAVPKATEDRVYVYVYDRVATLCVRTVSRHLGRTCSRRPTGRVHHEAARAVRLRAPPGVAADTGGSGALARLRAAMADDTGAIGPGVGDLKFARKVGLDVNNPAIANRGMSVQEFIAQFRSASVLREFPGEYLDQTVEQALKAGDSTVRKLLTDGRWAR